jgi:ribosomal protein S18 acetylase RimI-like enzyme
MKSKTMYIWLNGVEGIDGVVGLEKDNYLMTRVKHLSVQPNLRRMGIGEKLLKYAFTLVESKFIYATVKEENIASLSLCQKVGFKIVAKYQSDTGTVFLLVKEMNA